MILKIIKLKEKSIKDYSYRSYPDPETNKSLVGKLQKTGKLIGIKGLEFFDQIRDVLEIFSNWRSKPDMSKKELKKKGYNDLQIKTIENYINKLKIKELKNPQDQINFLKIIHKNPNYKSSPDKTKLEVNTIIKALNNKLDNTLKDIESENKPENKKEEETLINIEEL